MIIMAIFVIVMIVIEMMIAILKTTFLIRISAAIRIVRESFFRNKMRFLRRKKKIKARNCPKCGRLFVTLYAKFHSTRDK